MVGGTEAALTLDGLGQANGEEQDYGHKQDAAISFLEEQVDSSNAKRNGVHWTVPVWKAQQRSGLQSLWRRHVVPASPLLAV